MHDERICRYGAQPCGRARRAVQDEVRRMRRDRTPATAELVALVQADVDEWLLQGGSPFPEAPGARWERMKEIIRRHAAEHPPEGR